jgi:hypothetical protein
MKIVARKDGNGNVIITEDSFEMILNCLDNQKFLPIPPQSRGGEYGHQKDVEIMQDAIDQYNTRCREILNEKYIAETLLDGLYLGKKLEHQEGYSDWNKEEAITIQDVLSKNGKVMIKRFNGVFEFITIAENGQKNRPWTQMEIDQVQEIINKPKKK